MICRESQFRLRSALPQFFQSFKDDFAFTLGQQGNPVLVAAKKIGQHLSVLIDPFFQQITALFQRFELNLQVEQGRWGVGILGPIRLAFGAPAIEIAEDVHL